MQIKILQNWSSYKIVMDLTTQKYIKYLKLAPFFNYNLEMLLTY